MIEVSHRKLWQPATKILDPYGLDLNVDGLTSAVDQVIRRMISNLGLELQAGGTMTQSQVLAIISQAAGATFEKELEVAARPFLNGQYAAGARLAFEKLQALGADPFRASPAMTEVQNALSGAVDRQLVRMSSATGGSFRVRMREVVGEGLERGESIRQIAARVQAWAGKNNDPARATLSRATMIARTETRRAQIDAEVTSWKASGMVNKKQWLVSPQHCEFCGAAGKKKAIEIDKPFYRVGSTLTGTKGGLMRLDYETIMGPPLHPNCRCTLLPVAID